MEQLRKARKSKKMSQVALSQQLGYHQTYVSKYERSERRIDVLELIEICDALGVSVDEIVR
ncbi:MAG: helix-turn-helix transcriptional regulator [Pseudomonadota bacterium]